MARLRAWHGHFFHALDWSRGFDWGGRLWSGRGWRLHRLFCRSERDLWVRGGVRSGRDGPFVDIVAGASGTFGLVGTDGAFGAVGAGPFIDDIFPLFGATGPAGTFGLTGARAAGAFGALGAGPFIDDIFPLVGAVGLSAVGVGAFWDVATHH
jgi:hypothetical protein